MVIEYPGRRRTPAFRAVDGVDLTIRAGEVVGLVGESGSGKTTIGRAIVGLQPGDRGFAADRRPGHGRSDPKDLKPLRTKVGMVFQDPGSSLNPRLPIGESIAEPLLLHRGLKGAAMSTAVETLLDQVQLPRAMRNRYPHELSGGQRQRVGIARSLALEPQLLVADEPTSALDVSVQATVLALFQDLQREHGFACLFISHDLAVVEMLADRIAVMHNGKLVEVGGDRAGGRPPAGPVHAAAARRGAGAGPRRAAGPSGGARRAPARRSATSSSVTSCSTPRTPRRSTRTTSPTSTTSG